MTLLAPLFLLGLAGLAIPVIIHLVHRQKPEGKPFPSLMFLQKIPHKAQRRQKIRHWLIFALRCAAILLVVLAFARPLFERSPDALASLVGGRDIVMLVDRSLSMAYGDRWERGVEAARDAIGGMGPEDRMAIIAFDQEATALTEPSGDPLELTAALQTVTRGSGATRFSPALKLAQNLFDRGEQPRQELLVISDFQRTGWDRQDIVRFPDRVTVTAVNLSAPDAANTAVTSVQIRQDPRGDREEATVSARVINTGARPAEDLEVVLEVNGQVLQSKIVTVEPGSAEMVVFDPALVPLGQSRGAVRVTPDGLPDDDAFHFVLAPGQAIPVLVIENSSARENQSLYLERAFEVGTDPGFRVTVRPLRNLRMSDLDGPGVIVLNDAPLPGGTVGARIRELVREGAGLLVVLGTSNANWASGSDLIPGAVGTRVEPRAQRGASVTHLDYGHPVFEPFSGPRSGDFAAARVFRYRAMEVVPGDSVAVLARFDDGGVAVAERTVGEGRVLVLTTTADTYWNDFALQPVFLPFVHQVGKHLADYGRARPWFEVGAVADLAAYADRVPGGATVRGEFEAVDGEVVVVTPAGERLRLGQAEENLFKVAESGFYEVQPDDGNDTRIVLAANVDPAESDLTPVDVAEFTTSLSPVTDAAAAGDAAAGALSLDDQEQRQSVWWYLLVAAAIVFTVETLLSNRLSRVVRS